MNEISPTFIELQNDLILNGLNLQGKDGRDAKLSRAEADLLRVLLQNKYAVLTTDQLKAGYPHSTVVKAVCDLRKRMCGVGREVHQCGRGYSLVSNGVVKKILDDGGSIPEGIRNGLVEFSVHHEKIVFVPQRRIVKTPFRLFHHWQNLTESEARILSVLVNNVDRPVGYSQLLPPGVTMEIFLWGDRNMIRTSISRLNAKLGRCDGERLIIPPPKDNKNRNPQYILASKS